MSGIKVSIKQVKALPDNARINQVMDKGLNIIVTTGMHGLRESVVTNTPMCFGLLQNSILPNGPFKIPNGYMGEVVSSLAYAKYVETGTRKRRWDNPPPFGPIYLWVKRKFGGTEEEVKSHAWAVVWTIVKKGTKGHWMFKKGLQDYTPKFNAFATQAVEKLKRKIESL